MRAITPRHDGRKAIITQMIMPVALFFRISGGVRSAMVHIDHGRAGPVRVGHPGPVPGSKGIYD